MSDEMPPGWASAPLGALGTWGSGGTPPRGDAANYGGNIPWLKIGDLADGPVSSVEECITEQGLRNSAAKLLDKNVLLVAMYGSIGKLGITTTQCATNQAIAFCKPADGIDLTYLFYLLMAEKHRLVDQGQGGTQANISQTILKAHEVAIAPTELQKRIVSKIDELFSRIDEGERALKRVRKLVERYRQSVLKAAVTGELTREWREKQVKSGASTETGEALLTRILTARREAWEQAELDKIKAKGLKPKDDKWKQRYAAPTPAKLGLDESLPDTWVQSSLEQATRADRAIAYGVLQPGDDDPSGISMVRVCDVANGIVRRDELKKISKRVSDQFPRTLLQGGEVLLTLVGTIGRTAIVPIELAGANVARAVGVLTPVPLVRPQWLELCLRGQKARQLLTDNAREVARKTLNLEQLREFAVPIPCVEEQEVAISRVDELLSRANAAAHAIKQQINCSTALRQATLKSAFAGSLVAQDATDEPASTLLERIATERLSELPKPRRGPQIKKKDVK